MMYEEKDYILRLIHEIIRMLIKLISGQEIEAKQDICFSSENEEVYYKLIRMIDDGEIDLAENILIEKLSLNDKQYFQLSLLFYEYLNEKDNSFLSNHNFSRKEIFDGLKNIADICGYGSVFEIFKEETD